MASAPKMDPQNGSSVFEMYWRQLYERVHLKFAKWNTKAWRPLSKDEINMVLFVIQPIIMELFDRISKEHEND
jgi:hypothetical protein